MNTSHLLKMMQHFILVAQFIFISYLLMSRINGFDEELLDEEISSAIVMEKSETEKTVADGCHHVFIDGGSNVGTNGRFLFEPEKYPKAEANQKIFDEFFGMDRQNQDICVFAFEPNPMHEQKQQALEQAYQAMGWRYYYLPFAMGTKKTHIVFFRNSDIDAGSKNEEWGFAMNRRHGKTYKEDQVVNTTVIDFATWAENNIFRRALPQYNSKNFGSPKVVMKMDIEGSEYGVLAHMLAKGVSCKFDKIFGEIHHHRKGYFEGNGANEAGEILKSYQNIAKATHCSMFEISKSGHEYYLHDGVDLPVPSKKGI